jgi:hypothetical protein
LDVGFFGNDSEPPYVSKVVQSKKEAYAELKRRGLDVGKITEQPDIVRPKLIHGDLTDSLESLLSAGDEWFIDDGKLHVLKANGEVIDDFVPVISAESGLVGVPTRDMNMLELTTIINPSVKIGTMAEVKSSLNPRMNGMGKVVSVETTGDTDGDQWEQNVKLVMVGDVFNGL